MQALKDAIAETNRLKPQGNNMIITTNILAFLQEAASIGQALTSSINKPKSNKSSQNDLKLNTTEEEPSIQTMAT